MACNVSLILPRYGTNNCLPSMLCTSFFWTAEAEPQYFLYFWPPIVTISPGDSKWPANIEPIITIEAPNRIDLAMSPLYRTPPSATIGWWATALHAWIAANCQPPVPNPVFNLVMQALPGPIPTFVASAPALSKSITACGVAMLPTITKLSGNCFLI